MQFEKAYSFLIEKLEKELPEYLRYHNAAHTKDVLRAAEELAKAENVFGEDLVLLKTRLGLFHDAGFLETYSEYKPFPAKMARAWLPQFDYSRN